MRDLDPIFLEKRITELENKNPEPTEKPKLKVDKITDILHGGLSRVVTLLDSIKQYDIIIIEVLYNNNVCVESQMVPYELFKSLAAFQAFYWENTSTRRFIEVKYLNDTQIETRTDTVSSSTETSGVIYGVKIE